MALSRFAWLTLLALSGPMVAQAPAPDEPIKLAAVESYSQLPGFVDSALGFERWPAVDARYQDADPEVGGGPPVNPARRDAPSLNALRAATRRAYARSVVGDRVGAAAGIETAKKRFPDSVGIHWSEGWIRLNLLDFQGALTAWQVAEGLHGGRPFWVPYSKAIALIGSGDFDAALAWWRVAQGSMAPALDLPADVRNRFQHWKQLEKQLLEHVIELAYSPQQARLPATPGLNLRLLEAPVPIYPSALLREGVEGLTLVKVHVSPQGRPLQVEVFVSSRIAAFDAAALEAARLTRFDVPARFAAEGLWVTIPYAFKVRAPPTQMPQ